LEAIEMKRNVMIHLATAICICTASSAHAHHSHPLFYDQCKKVTIEGRVESAQWKNPHVLIVLKMDNGTTYTAEWTSLQGLTNRGVAGPAQAALMAGERVVVTGNPLRDSAQIRASFPNIKDIANPNVLDVIQIRRLDDSWSWAAETPAECK
jgi:Family of unknown function (DUF6152)